MKITTVAAKGFMGSQQFSLELGALNYIHGRNDTGKSRIARAIELALTGTARGIERKPAAIYDALGSSIEMEVELTIDSGASIHRSWDNRGPRGSIRHQHHVPREFDGQTPAVLLHADEYFSRSARGRVELIFASVTLEAGTISAVLDRVEEEIDNSTANLLCERAGKSQPTTQEWLDDAVTEAEKLRSEATGDVRRYTQTLQGLSTLQLGDAPATRSVEAIDADIDTETQAAAQAKAAASMFEIEQETNDRIAMERDDLVKRLQEAQPIPREFDIAALRHQYAELTEKVNAGRQAIWKHGQWERRDTERREEMERLTAEIERIRAEITEADIEPPRAPKPPCSKCKRPFAPVTAVHADTATKRLELANEEYRRYLTAFESREPAPEPPPADLEVLEQQLTLVTADIDEYTATLEIQGWRARLAEMPKELPDRTQDIADQRALAEKAQSRVTELREERKRAENDRHDRRRLAEAKREQESAIGREEQYKRLKKLLLDEKRTLTEKIMGPLLTTVAEFMDGIFAQPIEFRDGELGFETGSRFITEQTFGGARRALLHAGLQAALGARSPLRIVIQDELGTIDAENRQRLLVNVRQAHENGRFDQHIAIAPAPTAAPAGFRLIEAKGDTYEVLDT